LKSINSSLVQLPRNPRQLNPRPTLAASPRNGNRAGKSLPGADSITATPPEQMPSKGAVAAIFA
jgi:hypothetical protein